MSSTNNTPRDDGNSGIDTSVSPWPRRLASVVAALALLSQFDRTRPLVWLLLRVVSWVPLAARRLVDYPWVLYFENQLRRNRRSLTDGSEAQSAETFVTRWLGRRTSIYAGLSRAACSAMGAASSYADRADSASLALQPVNTFMPILIDGFTPGVGSLGPLFSTFHPASIVETLLDFAASMVAITPGSVAMTMASTWQWNAFKSTLEAAWTGLSAIPFRELIRAKVAAWMTPWVQALACVHADQRQLVASCKVSKVKAPYGHTHGEAAAARTEAIGYINAVASALDRERVDVSPSSREVAAGVAGVPSPHWWSDHAVGRVSAPSKDPLVSCIDTDFYMSDLPHKLATGFGFGPAPIALATWQPSFAGQRNHTLAWCFEYAGGCPSDLPVGQGMVADLCVRVSGNAKYRSPVWDFHHDKIAVQARWQGIPYSTVVYHVSIVPTTMDPMVVVVLQPQISWGLLGSVVLGVYDVLKHACRANWPTPLAYVPEAGCVTNLQRYAPIVRKRGPNAGSAPVDLVEIVDLPKDCVSIARVGSFHSVQMTYAAFTALQERAATGGTITASMVAALSDKKLKNGPETSTLSLIRAFGGRLAEPVQFVQSPARFALQVPKSDADQILLSQAQIPCNSPCLIDGSLVFAKTRAVVKLGVLGRVIDIADPRVEISRAQAALEQPLSAALKVVFGVALAHEPNKRLQLATGEEVRRSQTRKAQVIVLNADEDAPCPIDSDTYVKKAGFPKSEPVGTKTEGIDVAISLGDAWFMATKLSLKDIRMIFTAAEGEKVDLCRFMLGLAEFLKKTPGYAPGMEPEEVDEFITYLATSARTQVFEFPTTPRVNHWANGAEGPKLRARVQRLFRAGVFNNTLVCADVSKMDAQWKVLIRRIVHELCVFMADDKGTVTRLLSGQVCAKASMVADRDEVPCNLVFLVAFILMSGSPLTSSFNFLALLCLYASAIFLRAKELVAGKPDRPSDAVLARASIEAALHLQIASGDDSVNVGVTGGALVRAADLLGFPLKLTVCTDQPTSPRVNFLNRFYPQDIWRVSIPGICDIRRALSRINLGGNRIDAPEVRVLQKALGYYVTDAATPYLGPLASVATFIGCGDLVMETWTAARATGNVSWGKKQYEEIREASLEYLDENLEFAEAEIPEAMPHDLWLEAISHALYKAIEQAFRSEESELFTAASRILHHQIRGVQLWHATMDVYGTMACAREVVEHLSAINGLFWQTGYEGLGATASGRAPHRCKRVVPRTETVGGNPTFCGPECLRRRVLAHFLHNLPHVAGLSHSTVYVTTSPDYVVLDVHESDEGLVADSWISEPRGESRESREVVDMPPTLFGEEVSAAFARAALHMSQKELRAEDVVLDDDVLPPKPAPPTPAPEVPTPESGTPPQTPKPSEAKPSAGAVKSAKPKKNPGKSSAGPARKAPVVAAAKKRGGSAQKKPP